MNTLTTIELNPGSYVDYASLRNQDLIPAFIEILDELNDDIYVQTTLAEIGKIVVTYSDSSFWDSEVCIEVCNDLIERLNEFVPENHYFGAHPGNGSDFGVWEYDDF